MTRDGLARLFRVQPGTIARWAERERMPTAEGGGSGRQARYRPSDCVAWRFSQLEARHKEAVGGEGLHPLLERARKDRAQAQLAEQLLAVRAGKLVSADEVGQLMTTLIREASVAFRGLHSRIAGRHSLSRGILLDIEAMVHATLADLADGAGRISSGGAPALESDQAAHRNNGHEVAEVET